MTTKLFDLTLKRDDLICRHNFIAGEWVPARDAGTFEVGDPAHGKMFACVADSSAADAKDAADVAKAAFPQWRAVSARQRSQLLKRWHALILENSEDLAKLMCLEQGKTLGEARGEVAYGAAYIEWFAEEAVRTNGDILPPLVHGRKQMVVKEPVGVVAVITPWNFPMAMIARKLAPALAAGCTVVAKPAEDTPLTALALIKLIEAAGFPPGVVNIVTASRAKAPEVVGEWLKDPGIRKISFTGSTPIGKHLARESADTLKKLSLELGGNAPFIVFDDADIDAAIEGLMRGKFRNSGQACVSPNRIFVQDTIYDEFAKRLAPRVEALKVGPPARVDTEIGPMINERAIEKIDRHVIDAIDHGATLLAGGRRIRNEIANGPYYYAPTLLGDAKENMAVFCEETFGPVIPLFRFSTEEQVIKQANDTPFGLAAYFYSQNVKRIARVCAQLETGVIGINEGVVASEAAPFGGIKESGYGREGSRYGLDDYMHLKYLCQGELA